MSAEEKQCQIGDVKLVFHIRHQYMGHYMDHYMGHYMDQYMDHYMDLVFGLRDIYLGGVDCLIIVNYVSVITICFLSNKIFA